MKKLCIVLLLALMTGALCACNSEDVTALAPYQKQQIEAAWFAEKDSSFGAWYAEDEDGTCRDGVRYYGTYEGYDVLFMSGNTMAIDVETIGSETFTHGSALTLYAYKDGHFYLLRDVYENGNIGDRSIQKIAERHREYQMRLYGFIHEP